MLTLYARYNENELRALQAHCLDFCYCQYGDPEISAHDCSNCRHHRVCKDLTRLAHHCEIRINSGKSAHC